MAMPGVFLKPQCRRFQIFVQPQRRRVFYRRVVELDAGPVIAKHSAGYSHAAPSTMSFSSSLDQMEPGRCPLLVWDERYSLNRWCIAQIFQAWVLKNPMI
jgi:hypothetical protein